MDDSTIAKLFDSLINKHISKFEIQHEYYSYDGVNDIRLDGSFTAETLIKIAMCMKIAEEMELYIDKEENRQIKGQD